MTKKPKSKAITEISTADLGKLLGGLSARTIRALGERGDVVRIGPGRYDKWASVAAYCDHLRKAAAERQPTSGTSREKLRLIRLQGDALERGNREECAELIRVTDADAEWASVSKFVRDGCLAAVPRIAAALPHLGEAGLEIVRREIEDIVQVLNGPPPHRKLTKA